MKERAIKGHLEVTHYWKSMKMVPLASNGGHKLRKLMRITSQFFRVMWITNHSWYYKSYETDIANKKPKRKIHRKRFEEECKGNMGLSVWPWLKQWFTVFPCDWFESQMSFKIDSNMNCEKMICDSRIMIQICAHYYIWLNIL